MTLLINLAGLLLMAGIVWWFWLSNSTGKSRLSVIRHHHCSRGWRLQAGHPACRGQETLTLHFDRRDPSPCAEQVVFHGLDVGEFLKQVASPP